MSERLPRKYVLRGRRVFRQLFSSSGKSFRSAHLQIRFLVSEGTEPVLAAFIAPKRVFPRAVDRTKIKRWLREAFRKNRYLLVETVEAMRIAASATPESVESMEYVESSESKESLETAGSPESTDATVDEREDRTIPGGNVSSSGNVSSDGSLSSDGNVEFSGNINPNHNYKRVPSSVCLHVALLATKPPKSYQDVEKEVVELMQKVAKHRSCRS